MSNRERKQGLWHLTSPTLRRSSLQPDPCRGSKPRTKSNGDIENSCANENDRSTATIFDSKHYTFQLFNALRRDHSLHTLDVNDRGKKDESSSVRRSASDYATSSHQINALANVATTHELVRQRLQSSKEKDEERTPLLIAAPTQHDSLNDSYTPTPTPTRSFYGGGGLLLPLHQPKIQTKNQPKFSVEQSVFIEEDDDKVEANDTCEPLPQKKKQTPLWSRFSQKRSRTDENSDKNKNAPGAGSGIYRPLDRMSIRRGQHKSSLPNSHSPSLTTPSSSHIIPRSPDLGRSVTRGATTVDLDTTVDAAIQRVHASRCELYTNRAILLCILSGFVLFFVGSISFVAYVLTEKSYQENLLVVSPNIGERR